MFWSGDTGGGGWLLWKHNICCLFCQASGARCWGLPARPSARSSSVHLLAGQAGACVATSLLAVLAHGRTPDSVILIWVLARISHQSPAADADPTASATLNAAKVLDVLSSTPARLDSRSPCRCRRLRALASRTGVKFGLDSRRRVSLLFAPPNCPLFRFMLTAPVLGCHPTGHYVVEVRAIGVEYPIDRVAPTRGYPYPGHTHDTPSSGAVPHDTFDIKFARSGSAIRVSFSGCSDWFDLRRSSLPGGHESGLSP